MLRTASATLASNETAAGSGSHNSKMFIEAPPLTRVFDRESFRLRSKTQQA
jgi:hypothetical protein